MRCTSDQTLMGSVRRFMHAPLDGLLTDTARVPLIPSQAPCREAGLGGVVPVTACLFCPSVNRCFGRPRLGSFALLDTHYSVTKSV